MAAVSWRKASRPVLTEQVVVGLALVLECQTTVRDVVQILEPLEERHGHTTGVDVQIWDDQDVAIDQDLVGGRGGRTVGSFGDNLKSESRMVILAQLGSLQRNTVTYLGVDLVSIFASDNLLDGSWNEDVTWFVHQVLTLVRHSTGESNNGSMFISVVFQSLPNEKCKICVILFA